MRAKDVSVNLAGLTPAMQGALAKIEAAYLSVVEMVVTSANDGQHMAGSKHYTGEAVDIRTRQLSPEYKHRLRNVVGAALGPDYDVILEGEGTPREHLHCEFDPDPPRAKA